MNLQNATGKELVALYNQLSGKPIKRFATREEAVRRIAELRSRKYPLQANPWHARNHKRDHREVIELVFASLASEGVADPKHKGWATVKLRDARIDGMDAKIWAGHLTQLKKEGRYKRVKPGVGAVLVAAAE